MTTTKIVSDARLIIRLETEDGYPTGSAQRWVATLVHDNKAVHSSSDRGLHISAINTEIRWVLHELIDRFISTFLLTEVGEPDGDT